MVLEKLYYIFYTALKVITISFKGNQQKSQLNANSEFRKQYTPYFQENWESVLTCKM